MIIDTHTHFYDPFRPEGCPWPSPQEEQLYRTVLPEHFKEVAAPHGVTGTVVVEAASWVEDNQWILDMADDDPVILGLIGKCDVGTPQFAEQIERFACHPVFRGIRVWGDLDGGFLDDMALMADKGLVLDCAPNVQTWDECLRLARQLPALRLVVEHIAAVRVDGEAPDPEWVSFIQAVAEQPQVYLKVSALVENSAQQPAPADTDYYRPTLDTLWAAFGEDRLFFGSNWPVCERSATYETCIGIVRDYFEARDTSEKFFWDNAKACYGLPDHPQPASEGTDGPSD